MTPPKRLDPFRRAVLSGLGVLLPPLLTIAIFVWLGTTISGYVLTPLEVATRYVLVEYASDIRPASEFRDPPSTAGDTVRSRDNRLFRRAPDGMFLPDEVYSRVEASLGRKERPPETAREFYGKYVDAVWLRPWLVAPIFLSVFLLLLYLLGKFLAAGIGRFFWNRFEGLITRVPLVSNVYSSVKQVTDFLFTEPEISITRVVAVEYPRKGIWSLAFVTGESLLDIESAANEPVLSVLVPTSPMPFTGFTMTIKKSEAVDLNLTLDQAFQFIVSCGVVVPPSQLTRSVTERMRPGVNGAESGSTEPGPAEPAARFAASGGEGGP